MRNIRHTIGNTPIVKISEHLYGKLETYNPAGSVKDRMVSYVIQKAQQLWDNFENKTLNVSKTVEEKKEAGDDLKLKDNPYGKVGEVYGE